MAIHRENLAMNPFDVTDAMQTEYAREQELLRDVVTELVAQGIAAAYWHSGGGIFTVQVADGDHDWDFGTNGGDTGDAWGWDYSHTENGHLTSGDLMLDGVVLKDTTPVADVTAAIIDRIDATPVI
jgi:hypothetical protein